MFHNLSIKKKILFAILFVSVIMVFIGLFIAVYIYINDTVSRNSSEADITTGIKKYVYTMLLFLLFLIILSYVLADILQKFISAPILKLAAFAEKVTLSGDYSMRIERKGNDEISVLYNGFNKMLEQINNRESERDLAEAALTESEKHLKREKVKAQTAQEADHLKSAFLANMSHEIRTPMNAIKGFSGLLREPDLTEESRKEYIDIINKSSDMLMHLIDDIIDISKIEAGQLKINKSECSVNHILDEMFIYFEREIKNNNKENISFELKIPDKDKEITISTDVFRFRQIITNLLSNAIKFTEKGKVDVGYEISDDRKYIQFFVKDTGIGIPHDSLEEIFDRFKKIEDRRTKLYDGAGLGLAISKNLTELLGGKIWVESLQGKGSAFYFKLPYILTTGKAEVLDYIYQPDIKHLWNEKTILVVEDEDFVCRFFERVLGPTKAKIIWAKNGLEAVKICKSDIKIDVILMDMKLPELSGYEAVKRIKAYNNKIPIIAQTAYAMSEDRFTCLEVGCDDYISKPINPSLLMEKLSSVLN